MVHHHTFIHSAFAQTKYINTFNVHAESTLDYSQLLESKLSVFVDKHNMTAHSFYAALLEAQTQDKMAATIIQYLLGATEYRRFVDLLIDRKMFHFGPGSAHALASTSGRGHGGDNLSNGSGGCENGIDAGSKVSNEGGVTGTDTGAGASKSSDEPDNTREQNNTRDDGRQDEVASDFSRKVSEPDLRGDQNAGGKDSERDLDSESQRK